jgi:hypothetical protein
MATSYNPKTVTNGLILALDAANRKSYAGSGTVWTDLTGNANTGTLTNSPTFTGTNGGSIAFTAASSQYVDVANPTTFSFANTTFMVSMWIKTVSVTTQLVISKGYITDGWCWVLDSTGVVGADTKNNGTGASACSRNSIKVINDGIWHNVVVQYTTNTTTAASQDIQIYIDGTLSQGALTTPLTYSSNSAANLNIGRRSSGLYFNGNIANVQIYNRALSSQEVLQNFNATRSRFGV